jgi:maltooligosyltrehalose trehalohydrolase
VLLDVVYNHFGPSGNVTGEYGPYLNEKHQTPWGDAVNLDGAHSAAVRQFVVRNALYWLERYHLDGLRLDAVHALIDDSPTHVLAEMSEAVENLAARVDRPLWLIAEDERNDPRLVTPRDADGYGLSAVWADDFHHALHTALTGETQGYYGDYGALADLAKAIERAFVYDGGWSGVHERRHGRPAGDTDRWRFVTCTQNHDQVGNRARGDRLCALVGPRAAAVASALLLLTPGTPMLFQGEEWAASTPFAYFADFESEELAAAVRDGRRSEFVAFGWKPEEVPDPIAEETYRTSQLNWGERTSSPHREMLDWYRRLLRLRRGHADLTDNRAGAARVSFDESERWIVIERGRTTVAANLGARAVSITLPTNPGALLLASDIDATNVESNVVTLAPMSLVALARSAG